MITLLKLVSLAIWIMMMLCLLEPGLRLVRLLYRYRHRGFYRQRGPGNRSRLMGVNLESHPKLSLAALIIQA